MPECLWRNGSTNFNKEGELPDKCKKKKCPGCFPDENEAKTFCAHFLTEKMLDELDETKE